MKSRQTGFTLIEMMVVVAIIGILTASLFAGYNYIAKSARKAKAVEAVSNAATALALLYQKAEGWPNAILNASTHEKGFHVMDENVAKVLFKHNLLGVDCKKTSSASTLDAYTLRGVDRCGIADPWAQDVLKRADKSRSGGELLMSKVSSGGTVKDHLIYFAVDQDDDGFVTSSEGAPANKIRAKAIAWCAGADGALGLDGSDADSMKKRTDNVYSWQRGQEAK